MHARCVCGNHRAARELVPSFYPKDPGILLYRTTRPGVTCCTLGVYGQIQMPNGLLWTASATDGSLSGPGATYYLLTCGWSGTLKASRRVVKSFPDPWGSHGRS